MSEENLEDAEMMKGDTITTEMTKEMGGTAAGVTLTDRKAEIRRGQETERGRGGTEMGRGGTGLVRHGKSSREYLPGMTLDVKTTDTIITAGMADTTMAGDHPPPEIPLEV